jgi:hypothetical protein
VSGIRTHDPSVRASEGSSCLRPRGYCKRLTYPCTTLEIETRTPNRSPCSVRKSFLCKCLTSESEPYVTTDGQSTSLSWNIAPIWGVRPDFFCRRTVVGLLMWGALSDERTGLSFTIAAGSRQRSHSRVRIPLDLDHIILSQIRDFPFGSLLRLAGLQWRYSTPPPHGRM